MESQTFRTIWISDTHLGGRNLQSKDLLQLLKVTESEYLYYRQPCLSTFTVKTKVPDSTAGLTGTPGITFDELIPETQNP